MFSKKEKIKYGLIALAIVLVMFFGIWMMRMIAVAVSEPPRDSALYEVLHKDDEGYWVAIQVKKAEDDTYVPLRYYNDEDRMVVYKDENVDGATPEQFDIVRISVDKNGENPLVRLYTSNRLVNR